LVEPTLPPLRWGRRDGDGDDAEERRLLFVGMTRATTRLVLSSTARRPPSPYLADIEPALLDRQDGQARPQRQAWQLKLL